MTPLLALAAAALAAWLGVLLHPARPWDLRPRDGDLPPAPAPDPWPAVAVVVPARNEAGTLPGTLPALLAQDYPGPLRVVVVDDRSADGTAGAARRAAGGDPRLAVVHGAPLPEGWVGKVWAMQQGVRAAGEARWLLFTDADILHAPDGLRGLVARAEAAGLVLDSRMALLRCASGPERLLVPPFLLFFLLLYPLRWANRAGGRVAAAAGGCMLVRADALCAAGGPEAFRGALIDDLALARHLRGRGRVRLAVSTGAVRSVRAYETVGPLWHMVRRSAFTQLNRSWPLLAGVLLVLLLMFLVPPVALVAGLAGGLAGAGAAAWWAAALGAAAWLVTAVVTGPAVRLFGLGPAWRLTLPAAGLLYAGMTLDSALRGPRGGGWR